MLSTFTPTLYALTLSFLAFFPAKEITLFFALRIKAKWCALFLIASGMLSLLAEGEGIAFLLALISLLFSHLYTLMIFERPSLFTFLHPLDKQIIKFGRKIRSFRKKDGVVHGKIIDLRDKIKK